MKYIRILPEKNDPEAIRKFVVLLIQIARRLETKKLKSQENT